MKLYNRLNKNSVEEVVKRCSTFIMLLFDIMATN